MHPRLLWSLLLCNVLCCVLVVAAKVRLVAGVGGVSEQAGSAEVSLLAYGLWCYAFLGFLVELAQHSSCGRCSCSRASLSLHLQQVMQGRLSVQQGFVLLTHTHTLVYVLHRTRLAPQAAYRP
jgi:hypothetical protein